MASSKKEPLPLDFITSFVSKGWEEVGNLQASITGINQTFSGTQKVSKYIQDLVDAYLIALGLMEAYIDKKDYLDLPDTEELQEQLTEDLEIEVNPDSEKIVINVKDAPPEEPIKENSEIIEVTPTQTENEPFEFFTSFEDPVLDLTNESPYQAWMSNHN